MVHCFKTIRPSLALLLFSCWFYPNPQKYIIFDIFAASSWLLKSPFLVVDKPCSIVDESTSILHPPASRPGPKVYESDNALSLVMECMEGSDGSGRSESEKVSRLSPKTKEGLVPKADNCSCLVFFHLNESLADDWTWFLSNSLLPTGAFVCRCCFAILESRLTKLVKPGIPNPECSLKRYFGVYAFVFRWMISSIPNVLTDFYDISILNDVSPHQIFVNGR